MVVNFTANVPREMWGAQLQAMYDKAGGNADRMARAAFDASFCSDPARYDAYFSKNRSVAEIRRDPMVALTESVTVQRFTGGVDKGEKRVSGEARAAMPTCFTISVLRKGWRSIPTLTRPCA